VEGHGHLRTDHRPASGVVIKPLGGDAQQLGQLTIGHIEGVGEHRQTPPDLARGWNGRHSCIFLLNVVNVYIRLRSKGGMYIRRHEQGSAS
jgi:hypothetical protein